MYKNVYGQIWMFAILCLDISRRLTWFTQLHTPWVRLSNYVPSWKQSVSVTANSEPNPTKKNSKRFLAIVQNFEVQCAIFSSASCSSPKTSACHRFTVQSDKLCFELVFWQLCKMLKYNVPFSHRHRVPHLRLHRVTNFQSYRTTSANRPPKTVRGTPYCFLEWKFFFSQF